MSQWRQDRGRRPLEVASGVDKEVAVDNSVPFASQMLSSFSWPLRTV